MGYACGMSLPLLLHGMLHQNRLIERLGGLRDSFCRSDYPPFDPPSPSLFRACSCFVRHLLVLVSVSLSVFHGVGYEVVLYVLLHFLPSSHSSTRLVQKEEQALGRRIANAPTRKHFFNDIGHAFFLSCDSFCHLFAEVVSQLGSFDHLDVGRHEFSLLIHTALLIHNSHGSVRQADALSHFQRSYARLPAEVKLFHCAGVACTGVRQHMQAGFNLS
mmetsp:Transcript_5326/g.11993  ORF Transcript_5326/g.11993 Transcript_5326/m.11993 type:complete len:217 (+) Transcript_5326:1808-2458(+)